MNRKAMTMLGVVLLLPALATACYLLWGVVGLVACAVGFMCAIRW